MTVLITGGHGYMGWPTALRLAEQTDERVVIADNGARAAWSSAVGGVNLGARLNAQRLWTDAKPGLDSVDVDLTCRDAVDRLLATHEPDVVVHTAAQASAPYSELDGRRALETQLNNVAMNVNLLWGLREAGLEDVPLTETTTTGLYGAPPFSIPEGGLTAGLDVADGAGCVEVWEELSETDRELPFPNLGGSFYHATKGFDAANLRLANRKWGQPVADVRTAIVTGATTPEARRRRSLPPRLDVDFYFGTVVHRFCAQAVAGYPITVYGEGAQRKPFITLGDAVEGLVRLAIEGVDGHAVYNQVARPVAIVDVAEAVVDAATDAGFDTSVEHVENPREEDEEHQMRIDNDAYADLLDGGFEPLDDVVRELITTMAPMEEEVRAATDRFLPASLREEAEA